jgi:uncharacterized membrane protein YdjX (TVP38/TMEM64 family)
MMNARSPQRKIWLFAAAAVLAASVAAAVVLFSEGEDAWRVFLKLLQAVKRSGPFGPLVFLALFTAACIFLLPTFYLTIAAGLLFGLWEGFAVATVSVAAGASAAFLIARHRVRSGMLRLWGGGTRFLALDEAVTEDGWKIVFLTRLSPAFPFNIVNYAFGLTSVSFPVYLAASWTGSIPWTLMYVYSGSLAADMAGLHPEAVRDPNLHWTLSAFGLMATVAATCMAARTADRALKKRLRLEEKRAEAKEEDFSGLR